MHPAPKLLWGLVEGEYPLAACVGVFSEPLCRLPIKAAQLALSCPPWDLLRTWNFAAAVTKSLAAGRKVKAENQGLCNRAGAHRPNLSDLGHTSPRLSPEVAIGLRAVSLQSVESQCSFLVPGSPAAALVLHQLHLLVRNHQYFWIHLHSPVLQPLALPAGQTPSLHLYNPILLIICVLYK